MKQKLSLFVILALIAVTMSAQQVKNLPPSFAYQQVAKQQLQSAQKLAIPFDVQALKAEDERKEAAGFPERIAKTIPVQLTPENSGEWTTLPNGQRIWRLEIDAADANAVSLLYDQFIIPQGGKLYIYDLDYKVVNVYTDQDNPKRQEFSTDFIPGDKLILEYVALTSFEEMASFNNGGSQNGNSILSSEPAASGLQLVITGVSYAYKDVIASLNLKFKELFDDGSVDPRAPGANNGSAACEVNANCSEGDNWYHQKHGVAATTQVLSDGTYLCSGTAINNVLNDRTPYLLMAYHCGGEATPAQMNQWRFYFHWERTGCDNSSPLETYQSITGATSKVAIPLNGGSDGLLLQLNQSIPREWDVFFNGWDRQNTATAGGGVGIHHPGGDVMKISTYTQTPTQTTANMSTGEVGATNAHWNVAFVQTTNGWGVTEGGSSGSPLFNSAKRVIGTLTGGNSSCTATTGNNIYGKLAWDWDLSSDPNLWMAKYLDPNNTGAQYIDGTYGEANLVAFTASKTDIYASEEITFTNRSYGDIDTYEWDFGSTAQPATYTGYNPPAPVLYNVEGNYTVKLTAKKDGAVVDVFEVPIKVTLKQNYCPEPAVTVGDPSSTTTSPFPLGLSTGTANRQTFSSGIYTADELGMSNGGIITDLEWQANTAVTTARTLYVYLKEVDASTFSAGTTWANETNGLTAVYTSANTFTNPAGAVKIHLTTPFTYSGTKNLEVLVRALGGASASTNSNCLYTVTTGNTHQQWTSTTTTVPTTAGAPNANRPNIAVYYNAPCGANPPVADFTLSSSAIFEGQSVTITDKSTGPVVTYQWSFPGGIPATSTAPSPTVQYMHEGVYDITLYVKNTEGNNTKTVTGAVTVSSRTPVPVFTSSSNSFIKQADYGAFLPLTGGYVDFDATSTLYYPTSLSWSFPGGTPDNSNEVMPEVTYPEGAGNYDVTLNATNSAGTGTKTATNYVQVGGTATVWNLLYGESTNFNLAYGGYSIFAPGATGYFPTGCSERFVAPAGGEVTNAKVFVRAKSGSPIILVSIYSDNNGVPGVSLASVSVPNASITANSYMIATFANPVPVSGAFHVVVTRSSTTGSVSLGSTDNRTIDYNTSCVNYQNTWVSLYDILGYNASINITTDFTFTTAELTSPVAYTKKNIDSAPETVSFTTTGHAWTASASHAWIHLSAASGVVSGGNGSLTFTVDDNPIQNLRRGNINVNVAGTLFKIYVTQAGSYPIDVTAAYNSDNTGIEVDWRHDMQYTSGDIFDSGEDYAAFQKNPKWYYQWSYIDGDAQPTYGLTINGIPIPGTGDPLSFIAIDATSLGTASAHSGARYFACPASLNIPNDDWMISPELSFESSFTFSFWARALQSTYPESFNVAYSTGGKTEADFSNVVATVPSLTSTTWTKYTYTIPAEAKYVAINCVSNDAFMFMVDDIFIGTGTAPASLPVAKSLLALNVDDQNIYAKVKPGIPVSTNGNGINGGETNVTGITLPLVELKRGSMPEKATKNGKVSAIAIPQLQTVMKRSSGNVLKDASANAGEEALQWYNGSPSYIYGNPSSGGHMEVAIRFTPGDLVPYDKATINAVGIYTYRPCGNLVINIRQGSEIVYSQPVGDITDNLLSQRIELTSPVTIDASRDLFIGYEYDQYAGDPQDVYVPIADGGPQLVGKGDLFSQGGGPLTSASGLGGNWIISAYVQLPAVNLTFNVFRDGTQIANGLTEKTYLDTDELPQDTKVCYSVTAVYSDLALESTESNDACLYTNFIKIDGSTEFCQGGSVTLNAPEETGYTYQWYKGADPITDAIESSYVATESGDYHVVITTQASDVLTSETVTVTVYALPSAPVISSGATAISTGNTVTISIDNPDANLLYQWYNGTTVLGDPSTETSITVSEGGVYYAVAVNENGCISDPSNEIEITIVQTNSLFTPSASDENFAAPGEIKTLTLTVNDPDDYITSLGLKFFVTVPDWMSYTISGDVITFTADANVTGLLRSGVIRVWLGTDGSSFDSITGYEIPASQKSELTADMLNYSFADVTYNGTAKSVSVTLNSAYSGLGAITVLYNWSNFAPINVDDYTVTINAAEGANFDGITNLTLGSFKILPAALTIRPNNASRPYGVANPNFTLTFIGLAGSDSQANLSNLTVTTTATIFSLPGIYPIIAGGAQNPNYTITYQQGTLTIGKLDQTITYSQIPSMEVNSTFNVNASASSGLPVTYTGSDPAIAEIDSNGKITAKAEGTVTITMTQAGDEIYNAATEVTQQLVVKNLTGMDHVASQTITVYPNPVAKSTPVYVSADVDEALLTNAMINVYNASGSLVKNVKVTGKLTKIDLSVAPGTYLFTLKGKEGVIKNMKVIVK